MPNYQENMKLSNSAEELMYLINQNLAAITKGIEKFQMNVAIAKIYEVVNGLAKFQVKERNDDIVLCHTLKILIRIIEPMVPHLAEECWALINTKQSITFEPWPDVNLAYIEKNNVTIVIQINGKRRAEINTEKDMPEEMIMNKIRSIKNINDALSDKNILKSIYVPNKVLNIVLKS